MARSNSGRVSERWIAAQAPGHLRALFWLMGALIVAGCSESTGPTTGSLMIATTTSGEDPDGDGYSYRVSGRAGAPGSGRIGPNDTVRVSGVTVGTYRVTLEDVAPNCRLATEEEVEVTLPWNADATFQVVCAKNEGRLEIAAVTSGENRDPDGYTVRIDEGEPVALPVGGSVGPVVLTAGEHTVELADVAENCTVMEGTRRVVQVPFDATLRETFDVKCLTKSGGLTVAVETSGEDLDPDGYSVELDGGVERALGINGSVELSPLPSGPREVRLAGTAANCSVEGENPRTVQIPFGGESTETIFRVRCLSRTGNLEVRAETTGEDLDEDGYTVRIDGELAGSVPPNGFSVFSDIASGARTVALGDVAGNCTVADGDGRDVEVPFGGETVAVTFSVECARPSNLSVTVSTSGSDLDPDGYIVLLDGDPARLGLNDTHVFTDLTPDRYRLALTDVAVDCGVTTDNPLTVDLPGGTTIQASFDVSCRRLRGTLLFVSTRDGNNEIYRMNLDGSGLRRLTDHPADDRNPRPSPDGREIVFQSSRSGRAQIHVMDIDGSNVRKLTGTGANLHPNWSPNGTKIVFESRRAGSSDIFVMNRDGTEQTNLTKDSRAADELPMWSPSGDKIVFASDRSGPFDIFTMNADGSDPVNLTNHPGVDSNPRWAPDGSQISFSSRRHGREEVFVMDSDGSNQRNLTRFPDANEGRSWWSPDGSFISFTSDRDGAFDVYVMRASDGSGQRRLTSHPSTDFDAAWVP